MKTECVTTTMELPGYNIEQVVGICRGIIVRSRSIFGNIGAGIQSLFGGNITLFTDLCEQTRKDAYEAMVKHAQSMGANGIVNVRYDATEIAQGITEVLCYGTAVMVGKTAPD
jgi:uncharacterized protein YbjQ (UPF0145 family)